jgi:hypothetical protein
MDDLQHRLTHDLKERISNLAANVVHHKNISLCVCVHEIFVKQLRLLFLNSQYLLLFNFPRDQSSVTHLAKQICPKKSSFLQACYQYATKSGYGYLFIDFTQTQNRILRYRNSIFPEEDTLLFAPLI